MTMPSVGARRSSSTTPKGFSTRPRTCPFVTWSRRVWSSCRSPPERVRSQRDSEQTTGGSLDASGAGRSTIPIAAIRWCKPRTPRRAILPWNSSGLPASSVMAGLPWRRAALRKVPSPLLPCRMISGTTIIAISRAAIEWRSART